MDSCDAWMLPVVLLGYEITKYTAQELEELLRLRLENAVAGFRARVVSFPKEVYERERP